VSVEQISPLKDVNRAPFSRLPGKSPEIADTNHIPIPDWNRNPSKLAEELPLKVLVVEDNAARVTEHY
jgi:hypothetical protein